MMTWVPENHPKSPQEQPKTSLNKMCDQNDMIIHRVVILRYIHTYNTSYDAQRGHQFPCASPEHLQQLPSEIPTAKRTGIAQHNHLHEDFATGALGLRV